jgi:hypothetical protein
VTFPRSHRPLPDVDAAIDELTGEQRRVVAHRWADRARNELTTSTCFAEIYRALVALEAPFELLATASRAVDDELRHAEICTFVAGRYAGAAVEMPRVAVFQPTRFHGCSPAQSQLLLVVLHSCLNEGIAVSYMQACLASARGTLARAAVREIMQDEVLHARLGWSLLATRSASDRDVVERALPELVAAMVPPWLDHAGYPDDLPPGHGSLRIAEGRATTIEALDQLILPGFEHLGIDARDARAKMNEFLAD